MVTIVGVELVKKLPDKTVVGSVNRIEGNVKLFDAVGTPPWVYLRIKRKEWLKPDALEETDYERGWPSPISGKFVIDFKPDKEGDYKVSVVATPAPLSLPVVGVFPTLAESDVMEVKVSKVEAAFRFSAVVIDGKTLTLTDHDADSKFNIRKNTSDTLEITPSFEWAGPGKKAVISIRAGHRGLLGGFNPDTQEYTQNIDLPESPDAPYTGSVSQAIKVPLVDAGNISDGAIEIVAKLPGAPDYISQIWNVFQTKEPEGAFRFTDVAIDGHVVDLPGKTVDSGLLLQKTTSDYLDIKPGFEWRGPQKTAVISVKAGYRDWLGGFSPKTGEYNKSIQLPAALDNVYAGETDSAIRVPLTAAAGLDDGALEIVLKVSGMSDYIVHIWNVYATKEGPGPGEQIAFDLARPTATPARVSPGNNVSISCPVISMSSKSQNVTVVVNIYEGSVLPGRGQLIETKSKDIVIAPNETVNVTVSHTAAAGTIDRRDVGVQVVVAGKAVDNEEWDDIFYVSQPGGTGDKIAFDLVRPTPTPYQVLPGNSVMLSIPVISQCDQVKNVTAKVMVYEGSILSTRGTLLDTKVVSFTISPNQTYNVTTTHISVAGSIDRRDVGIQLLIGGQVVDSAEWDDIYYVVPPGGGGDGGSQTPPAADIRNLDMLVQSGTYNIGDSVPFTLRYEYKGKSQTGQMKLSLGTGVYPTFIVRTEYQPMSVGFDQAMDWTPVQISGTFVLTATLEKGQTYSLRTKLETLSDPTQETDTDWGIIKIGQASTGISFQAGIWGTPSFGSYQYWSCSYWDPATSSFVGDLKWYAASSKIGFSNVKPGGYLAIFIKRDATVSSQYNSPVFEPVDGGTYTYDIQLGRFY